MKMEKFGSKEQNEQQENAAAQTVNPENVANSNEETMRVKRVHNLIILDESGSMSSIYEPALTGVNETLQSIRSANEKNDQEYLVTLVTFDSEHYNAIYEDVPAEKALNITKEQYQPCACTPLYDAMGKAITRLRSKVNPEDVVLVTIITDGYENASREYSGAAIKALVEEMRNHKWVFTYIGANQDVDKVADKLSIKNRMAFQATDEGTREMFASESHSREVFYSKLASCSRFEDIEKNYFILDPPSDCPEDLTSPVNQNDPKDVKNEGKKGWFRKKR